MKKTILALVLTLALVLSLAACGGAPNSNSGTPAPDSGSTPAPATDSGAPADGGGEDREWKEMTLTYSTFLAADAPSQTQIDMFLEKVNERMDGAIQVTTYANGSMLSAGDTFDGIASGVADMGLLLNSTCVGRLPMTLLCDVPGFYYASGTAGARTMYDYLNTIQPEELEDVVVLYVLALAPQCFATSKPIETMSDLSGMQIYCPASFTEAIQRWGATPSTVAQSEIYEATRNGLVDGTLRSVGATANGMMGEITNYCTVIPIVGQANMLIMNRDVFESMPDYQQEVFLEVWAEIQHEFVDYYIEDFTYGDDVISQEYVRDVEHFNYLSDEALDEMYAAVKDLPDKYAEELNAQGYDGTGALKLYRELLEKYNEEYPTDPDIYLKWRQ